MDQNACIALVIFFGILMLSWIIASIAIKKTSVPSFEGKWLSTEGDHVCKPPEIKSPQYLGRRWICKCGRCYEVIDRFPSLRNLESKYHKNVQSTIELEWQEFDFNERYNIKL